ncbi:MAG: hypothetical protein K6T63_12035 [Alicyclobacillus herbarius]|uniref:hypothetical protein n=1 Tax=Alicyclobacillus TaxID=29330 RepID=UPI00082EEB75|nr:MULTISPECIES: hypothetical protein [Alicyclobacillus]MCL6633347.1 hypothetical protein [Alicyclobacillus herbarius]
MMHPDLNDAVLKANLNEEVWNVLEIKARLWTNGDKQELIKRAVAAYKEPIQFMESAHCPKCGQLAEERLDTFDTVNGVVIDGVPTIVCNHCGNKAWDLLLIGKLEQMALSLPSGTKTSLDEMMSIH